jgi:hypothetical protein
MQTSTLRPGLLVSLKTSVRGNVTYEKEIIASPSTTEDGTEVSRWETTRVVIDPEELERAKKVRGRAQALVRGVCTKSAFGLLCPLDAADRLDSGMKEARELVAAFNADSKQTKVAVYVITGKISKDDKEAVRAINSELLEALDSMADAMQRMNVDDLREAATTAKDLSNMLSPEAQARAIVAVEAIRKAATAIKKGDQTEPDKWALNKVAEARLAFLDLEAPTEAPSAPPVAPTLDTGAVRAPLPAAAPAASTLDFGEG